MTKYRVRFYKEVTTTDNMSIEVAADSPEAARERVRAYMCGEIEDLTDAEMLSESIVDESDVQSSEFTGLADEDAPNAVVEVV